MGAGAPQGLSRRARLAILGAALLGAIVLVLVLFVRTDTQSFRAPSLSMDPTIEQEERFTLNEDAYDGADPQRYDIVVIRPPVGALEGAKCGRMPRPGRVCDRPRGGPADVRFVERVVGLPGERLSIVDGKAVIDGRPLDEPYANLDACAGTVCTFRRPVTIPAGHYFVMGDNRGASDDSRFWGPVPRDQFVGRVDDCAPLGLWCKEDDRTG